MKLFYLTASLFLTLQFNSFGATYTSAGNGNWTNPSTWSPMGVPLPADVVIINHAVVLNSSLQVLNSVTVNATGSLIQDNGTRDIWMNSPNASINNSGNIGIRYLLLSSGIVTNSGYFSTASSHSSVTVNNTGDFLATDSLFNNAGASFNNNGALLTKTFFNQGTINNYGIIKGVTLQVDSLYNNSTFTNYAGGSIAADKATNNGTFVSHSDVTFDYFTNYINGNFTNNDTMYFAYMTNMGTFTNNKYLDGAYRMWNSENLINSATGNLVVAEGFLNADAVNSTATFTCDGDMDVMNFYNYLAVTGTNTGSIIVQDSSVNYGTMTGTFDFCDQTPPAGFPKIDYNFGSVASSIYFCGVLAVNENSIQSIQVYPNPTQGIIKFGSENQHVALLNVTGKQLVKAFTNQLDLTRFDSGVYFIQLMNENGTILSTEKVIKQ